MILVDPETTGIVDANRAACSYYGYTKEEFLHKKITDINIMSPEDIQEEINRANREGRRQFYFMHRLASGIVRPVEVFCGPVEIAGKQLHYSMIHDITERREIEGALRRSEEKFRSIIQNMLDAYFECDLAGRFTFANENVCSTLGYTLDELLQMDYRAFTSPEMAQKVKAVYNQTFLTGAPGTLVDYEIICRDGTVLFQELSVGLMHDTAGNPIGFRTVSRNITRRKEAERKFQELARLNQTILDTVNVGLILVKDRKYGWMNRAYIDMMGYSYEETINASTSRNYVHLEEYQQIGVEAPAILSKGEVYSREVLCKGKDGRPFWVNLQGKALNPNNLSEGSVWMLMNIDERKKAEEAVLLMQFAMDHAPENILLIDDMGYVIYANDASCASLGYSHEELIKMKVFDIDPDFPIEGWEQHKEDLKKLNRMTLQGRHRRKNGSLFPVEVITNYLEYKGHFLGVAFDQDITERKKAEEELRRSEEKYRAILVNMTDGYFETDLSGKITFVNEAACAMMNGAPDQLIEQESRQFMTPATRKYLKERYRHLIETGQPDIMSEYEVITCNGLIRVHQGNATLRKNASGNPVGFSIVVRDITARKQAEEALHQSEERIRVLFNNIPVPTFVWKGNHQNITLEEFNSTALEFTRGDIAAFTGKTAEEYFTDFPAIPAKIRQCLFSQTSLENSFWYQRKSDPEARYVTVKYAYAAPDHVIMHVNDLTTQKKAEEKFQHISIHDSLTGLYNRFYSDAEIERITSSRIRPVSFIMIDLNDLKRINDQKGHAAGDLYIKNTAALLKLTFRPEDMLARIGGDEFIVMLPLVDEKTCAHALERLRDHLLHFNQSADQPISLAAAFSTARAGDNIMAIIAEADRLMYEEKAKMKAAAGSARPAV